VPRIGFGGRRGKRAPDAWLSMAVAARRALSDSEEALARLSAGNYGICEQCGSEIPLAELVAEPEVRSGTADAASHA
jgi:RNA polymerase-binding transcription factor DksA